MEKMNNKCACKFCLQFLNLLLFVFFSKGYSSHAAPVDGSTKQSLQISLYIDKDRKIHPENILSFPKVLLEKEVPSLGFYDGAIWLSFSINADEWPEEKQLMFKNPNLDNIQLYRRIHTEKKFSLKEETGDMLPYSLRKIWHHRMILTLEKPAGKSCEYLVRIDNHGDQFFVPFVIGTKEEIASSDYSEQFINGSYLGLLIFIILLNLFIILFVKDYENIYYLLYLLSFLFLQLALSGYSFQWFWPEHPWWHNRSLPFFASLAVLFMANFTTHFLQLKNFLPKVHQFFIISGVVLGINAFLALVPGMFFYRTSILIVNVLTLLLNMFILPVAWIILNKNYKPARFYLLAFSSLIVVVFIFVFRNFGVVPSNAFTDYSLQWGSAIEVILLTFAVIDKFKSFKDTALEKANEINVLKSTQNKMLEQQVKARTAEIEEQKERIEEKNKSILDSINYSLRIQQSMLPGKKQLDDCLTNYFVLYLPKDIVAGDFYWTQEIVIEASTYVGVAVADCTGHGVPGALVSMVCAAALNRAFIEDRITQPAKLLERARDLVSENLKSDHEDIKDGMDISLLVIEKETGKIYWSGANNPIWIARETGIEKIKADKQPVGFDEQKMPFTNHEVFVNAGEMVYLFSDGFADQFGGKDNKKYTYKRLENLLYSVKSLSTDTQKEVLIKAFEEWKGDEEQTDDVCMIGIRPFTVG
jgi:serine phosphatase RsbU (regulator of sigma subunit)